jgi:translocation and assembly module TamB
LRSARLDGRVALSGDAAVQNAVLALSDGVQRLDAEIVRRGETLDFSRLLLVRGSAELSGSGQVQLDAPRAWHFAGQLRHFDLASFAKAPRSDLNAEIAGSGRLAPQYDGRLRFLFAKSRFAGEALDGSGDLVFSALDEAAGLLAAQGASRVRGSVDLRLGDSRLKLTGGWGGKEERLQVELKAPALARHELGLRGALELSATLSGGAARPDILLSASARGLGLPGHSVERFDVQGRLQGEALELDVTAEGYRQEGNARLARLHLTVAGTRERNRVHAEARLDAARSVTLAAAGALRAASEDWRDTAWQGEIETLAVSGALPLRLSAPARVEASRQRISLGEAQVAFADGRIMLAESTWTPQRWSSRGRFSGIALRPGGLGGGDGETPLLRMGGEWSLAGAGHIDGWLRAARESGDWVLPGDLPRPLGLDDLRLEAKSAGGRLRAELAANGARIGRWQASATLPLARGPSGWGVAPHAALEGQVRAVVPDIAWAGPAIDGNLTSAGALEIDAQLAGTLEAPWMRGHILGSGLAVGFIDQNVNLRDGVLKLRFEREILHIERLEFSASHDLPARSARVVGFSAKGEAGRVAVSGTLDLQRRRARLIAALTRLPLVQRPERWIVASGSGRLDYAGERLKFGADLRADAGFIAQAASGYPQLADDVVIVGREKPAQQGPRIESDISLDLGEHFHLRAAGLSARLSGRLRVRGNGSGPLSATGSIATQDAWFEAYGQSLTVERGIVNFQGPLDDPGLNVQALRKGGAVEAGVAVTGTAQHPVVRLISTPPVPDAEKLSWIVLGRAPDSGGADASLLFAAASAILGGQGEGVTQKIAQTLGVDELSLRQEKGGDPLTSQILTMGKRLSARTFLSYEQGLMASAGVMKLTVTLTPRISIVTRAGGDNAVDVFYNFTFD